MAPFKLFISFVTVFCKVTWNDVCNHGWQCSKANEIQGQHKRTVPAGSGCRVESRFCTFRRQARRSSSSSCQSNDCCTSAATYKQQPRPGFLASILVAHTLPVLLNITQSTKFSTPMHIHVCTCRWTTCRSTQRPTGLSTETATLSTARLAIASCKTEKVKDQLPDWAMRLALLRCRAQERRCKPLGHQ